MAIDETRDADVTISLAVAPTKKVWASRVSIGPTYIRNAGTLQAGSNAHSGLAFACAHALRSISKEKLRKFKVDGVPEIRIVTEDQMFADAIRAFVNSERVTTLRSSRHLWHTLKKALNRGKIQTLVVADTDSRIMSLKGWAINTLTPEKEDRVSLRVFTPQRVAESHNV